MSDYKHEKSEAIVSMNEIGHAKTLTEIDNSNRNGANFIQQRIHVKKSARGSRHI